MHTKLTETDLYASSIYAEPRALAADYGARGGAFGKSDIEKRSLNLADYVGARWAIW